MKFYMHVKKWVGNINVYYLNKEGRDLIGSDNKVNWSLYMEHHLLRNQVFIHYSCPQDWVIEKKTFFTPAPGQPEKYITPDARFSVKEVRYFLEVDRTQSMVDNRAKIERYKELSPLIEAQFGHKPVIVWYTARISRVEKLKELCEEAGLQCDVWSFDDLR
jgi:hypothetical protein